MTGGPLKEILIKRSYTVFLEVELGSDFSVKHKFF